MHITKIEVEAFGEEINAAVLRLPSRQHPGILIQGDSLQNLLSIVRSVEESLAKGDVAEACELSGEASAVLEGYFAAYRRALD